LLRFQIIFLILDQTNKAKMRSLSVIFFCILIIRNSYGQIGFPYCEPFDGSSIQEATVFGGNARLIDGVLRLTENQTNQRGYVYVDIPFPSVFGIKASFEYFSYGGDIVNRADGISFFLFDADVPVFTAGGFGGSLGYAQKGNDPGLSRAYIGIGFDEFGNFGNTAENKVGGFPGAGTDLVPDAIAIRGPGNGTSGYAFLVGRKTMLTGNDGLSPGGQFPISSGGPGTNRVTDPNLPGYRKVFLDLQPKPDGTGYFVKLQMRVTTAQGQPRMVTIFDRPYDFPAPKNLKIGFAASTGGFTNFHEIKNLLVEVSNDEALEDPKGVDFDEIASCEGQENTYFITDEEVVLPNESSVIRCLQFYASLEDIEEESGDVCSQAKCREENRILELPQGTFKAGDVGGEFTFFPNPGFTDQKVTVYYTLTDSYGKSSSGNSMALTIQESPEPINLRVSGSQEAQNEEIRLCQGDSVSLIGSGEEAYFRFEWFRDGELVEGADQNTYTVTESGEYQILGYNRKNCAAKSNIVKVDYPELPPFIISNPTVGCTPGQSVDVTTSISDFELTSYDYLLKGQGQEYRNQALTSISVSAVFELLVKYKDLDCYGEPLQLEVVILDQPLEVNFDFMVEGTDIIGDGQGGIFPDDPIQFIDRSDSRTVIRDWDFSDGATSNERNPVHVFGKKGQFEVELTITDQYGCTQTITNLVSITRSYRVMFPTGFTPLDALNQTFVPKFKGISKLEFMIFNSWGQLIFRTDELTTEGWDGKLNGELLDSGFYFFKFNAVAIDGEKVVEEGKFKLIR
jgi:gliding motility-associated-like protein